VKEDLDEREEENLQDRPSGGKNVLWPVSRKKKKLGGAAGNEKRETLEPFHLRKKTWEVVSG